jgi:hypothetical protein
LWLLRIIISIEEGYYTCTQHVWCVTWYY